MAAIPFALKRPQPRTSAMLPATLSKQSPEAHAFRAERPAPTPILACLA